MRSNYKAYEKEGIYFITSTVIEHIPIFTNYDMCKVLTDTFEYSRKNLNLKLFAYVIMDNHFHAIISSNDFTKSIQSIKRFTAKLILEFVLKSNNNWLVNQLKYWKKGYKDKSNFQIWQEGVHPQKIIDDDMMKQKIEYIHNNPVKRGLVSDAESWIFSSARNYANLDSVIEIDKYEI